MPGIQTLSLHFEKDGFPVRPASVCPVIIGINFCIQGQLSQQKPHHWLCHSPVIHSRLIAPLFTQKRRRFRKFFHNEIKHFRTLFLNNIFNCRITLFNQWNAPEQIHNIIIKHGSQCPYFSHTICHIFPGMFFSKILYSFQRAITQNHRAIQVFPGGINRLIVHSPAMQVQSLPESTVIPVPSTRGHDSLISSKRIQIIDTPT